MWDWDKTDRYLRNVNESIIATVTNGNFLLQAALILAATLASIILARTIAAPMTRPSERKNYFVSIASRLRIPPRTLLLLVLLSLLLWICAIAMRASGWPHRLIDSAAALFSAWTVIRLATSVIKNQFWTITLALLIWGITALSLLGWLEPVTAALNAAAITIGTLRLSMLLVIKAILVFALFLWLANIGSIAVERGLDRSHAFSLSQQVLFSKLVRIAFISLAILIGLNVLGIDLTALAVFSGALGIGIGFGLQKAFSNLVSGFILLMDKSIKPGDVIAIGDTYGWVNKLSARHVSILTRDGKEHLIPNEKLITENVENWSYSSAHIRIHIPIHVSYNSDIHLVKKILLEVAREQKRVLEHPAPNVLIKGFGENSVNFEIRAWIQDPVNGIGNVRSALYEAIWDAFKEHKIEIPFPQRDLHVRSWAPEAYASFKRPHHQD